MKRKILGFTLLATLLAGTITALAPPEACAAGPGVHGRVMGHDEKGAYLGIVPGAKIDFQSRAGQTVASTKADANGYYKVDLPPGEYLYKIVAQDYKDEKAGRGMRLEASQGYALFNLALTKGKTDPSEKPPPVTLVKIGKLKGRVLEKTARELVGIPEARISLRKTGGQKLITVYSRGSDDAQRHTGNYEVTLEVGVYHASVVAAGFEPLTDPQPIEIRADEETNRDFILARPQPEEVANQGIRGVVTLVDSVAVSSHPPIKLEIVPLPRGGEPLHLAPGAGGAYSQELPVGRYRVIASAEGFPTQASRPVYVFAGRFTIVNLVLRAEEVPHPSTAVEVFVYRRAPEGAEPEPISDADVSLLKEDADAATAQEGKTDATGHVVFQVTAEGNYRAEAHKKGFRAGRGQGLVKLGQSHEVAIELIPETTPPAALRLNVAVADSVTKRPLAGAKVLARHSKGTLADAARGSTDSQGESHLTVTQPGQYTLVAQLSGYKPGGAKIDVVPGRVNFGAISLIPLESPATHVEPEQAVEPADRRQPPKLELVAGYVAFRELSGQLRAVPGARLVWERIAPSDPLSTQIAASGSNGRYQIELQVGTYQVCVLPPPGFEPLLETVEVVEGMENKYFIVRRVERPPPPPTDHELVNVKGVVLTEVRGTSTGVAAEVLFLHDSTASRSDSNAGGQFGIQLPAGRYRLHVRARGFEPLDTWADVQAGMSPLRLVLKPSESLPSGVELKLLVVERIGGRMLGATRPVSGASVQVGTSGRMVGAGVTNRAGEFALRVKPGNYQVRVNKSGYAPESDDVTVGMRDMTHQIVLTSTGKPDDARPRSTMLHVHVTQRAEQRTTTILPTGRPLGGAQITVMQGMRPVASGTTNSGGMFTTQLPPGSYAIKAAANGFAPAGKTAVLADRDVTVEFQLARISGGIDRVRPLPVDRFRLPIRPPMEQKPPIEQKVPLDLKRPLRFRTPLDLRAQMPIAQLSYVVEYRMKGGSWQSYGSYPSASDAQRALFMAIERTRIPRTAETRIVTH